MRWQVWKMVWASCVIGGKARETPTEKLRRNTLHVSLLSHQQIPKEMVLLRHPWRLLPTHQRRLSPRKKTPALQTQKRQVRLCGVGKLLLMAIWGAAGVLEFLMSFLAELLNKFSWY